MRNPEALDNLANNSRVKILYDPGTGYQDDADEEELQAAMEASLRTPTPPPSVIVNTVAHFFRRGTLEHSQSMPNGFYACFGEFPEIADKGEVPLLANLRLCQIVEGRDVISFDLSSDPALVEFKHQVLRGQSGGTALARAAWVAQLVAQRLGGAQSDRDLQQPYTEYSATLQARHNSVILPVGELTVRCA